MTSWFCTPRAKRAAFALLVCTLVPTCAVSNTTAPSDDGTIDGALRVAKTAHEPVLVDFSALWCHSCWWMKTNVMTGAQWDGLMKRVVYVEADADSSAGAAWMDKLHVEGLPTYIVLSADGAEIGRVVGEAKREEFYPRIERLSEGSDTLELLKAKANNGAPSDIAEVLDAYAARNDREQGLAWYDSLPQPLRTIADRDGKVAANLEFVRMDSAKRKLMSAKKTSDRTRLIQSCVAHGQRALLYKPDYDDRIQIIDALSDCTEGMSLPQRKQILAAPLSEATANLYQEKLQKRPLPPGSREALILLAEAKKTLGDRTGADEIYARGIAAYREQLSDGHGGLDLGRDRSAADDLYGLYRFSEQKDPLRALVKRLAETFSDDCNYSLAYGSLLVKEDKPSEALPYLERAAGMAHGRYVLKVANARVKALVALSRQAEAAKVAADALRASGSAFPREQDALKKLIVTPSPV